jgi:hypothetical protein
MLWCSQGVVLVAVLTFIRADSFEDYFTFLFSARGAISGSPVGK